VSFPQERVFTVKHYLTSHSYLACQMDGFIQ